MSTQLLDSAVSSVVIPAAGLGTRFLPFTKAVPKELVPAYDRPVIHYAVREAMAAGIERIVIVTARGKEALQQYFEPEPRIEQMMYDKGLGAIADELRSFRNNLRFSYPIQEEQLGLGHAVLCGKEDVGQEPFAVILPDDLVIHAEPALVQMMGAWCANPGNYIAVEEVPPERVSSYGIVAPAPDGALDSRTTRLLGMVEKPPVDQAPSNLGIVGRYILMPEVLRAIESTEPGAIGEIQLTDGIAATMDRIPTYAYRFQGDRHDCGNPIGLLKASLALSGVDS